MQEAYIGMRSLTYAQRAARYLTGRGLQAAPTRAPWTGTGCAYAVSLRAGDLEKAQSLLRQANLTPGRAYLRDREGRLREAEP